MGILTSGDGDGCDDDVFGIAFDTATPLVAAILVYPLLIGVAGQKLAVLVPETARVIPAMPPSPHVQYRMRPVTRPLVCVIFGGMVTIELVIAHEVELLDLLEGLPMPCGVGGSVEVANVEELLLLRESSGFGRVIEAEKMEGELELLRELSGFRVVVKLKGVEVKPLRVELSAGFCDADAAEVANVVAFSET